MATMEVEDASLQPVVQSSSAVNHAQQQQAIAFSPKFSFNNFILLEVDEKLADELLCSNNSNGLYVRGWQTDEAVLCTESTTNACREVEISNSLLILDGRPMPMEGNVGGLSEMERELGLPALRIASVTNCFVEVSAATPSGLRRLKELLEAKGQMNLFTETAEDDQNKIGISWPSLLSQMQMSEQQLVAELAKYPLVKKDKDGHFCLVSHESIWRLLDFVIELCQSTGEAKFTREFLRSGLPESVPADVIDWFMREYCEEADDGTHFSLVESKVSRARVEQLLLLTSPPDKQLDFEQFEQRVNSTLPDNFRLREEHLLGLALVNQSHFHGKTLRRLLLTDMPIDLHKRLSLLFSLRHSWRKEEIQPYIMDFCPNAAKVEEFLMKHCRLTGSAADRHFVYKQLNY